MAEYNNQKSKSPPEIYDLLVPTKEIQEFKRLVLRDVKQVMSLLDNSVKLDLDEIINLQKSIISDLSSTSDIDIRQTIVGSIQQISDKILEVAERKLTSTNSENPVMNITYALIRLDILDQKMIFWVNSLNKQRCLLQSLLNDNLDKYSEQVICKSLLNYCDILVPVFEKELKSNEKNYIVEDDLSIIKKALKETRDLKTDILIRLKKMREYEVVNQEKKGPAGFFSSLLNRTDDKSTKYDT